MKIHRPSLLALVAFLLTLTSCNRAPVKDMEYLKAKKYFRQTQFEHAGGRGFAFRSVTRHYHDQYQKWTGLPEGCESADHPEVFTLQAEGKANLRNVVLTEPVAILFDDREKRKQGFVRMKGMPVAQTLREARTLIDIQLISSSYSISIYDMATGFAYEKKKSVGFYRFHAEERKELLADIHESLSAMRFGSRQESSPGMYEWLIETLGGCNGFDLLAEILEKDDSGVPDLFSRHPALKTESIRAFIMPKSYHSVIREVKGNWTLPSLAELLQPGNLLIYFNPYNPEKDWGKDEYIAVAYMEGYNYYGRYTSGAIGYSTDNVLHLINLRTGETEAVRRKTLYPPNSFRVRQGSTGSDQLHYWKDYQQMAADVFGKTN